MNNYQSSIYSNSPHQQQQQTPASPYLPGFLLGDRNPPHQTFSRALSTSGPQITSPPKMTAKKTSFKENISPYSSPADRKLFRSSPDRPSATMGKEKPNAPPTEGLYPSAPSVMDIDSKPLVTSQSRSDVTMFGTQGTSLTGTDFQKGSVSDFNNSVFSPRLDKLQPQSPAQVDPFYTEGDTITTDDVMDDTAVTVFGYPPAASSFILQQFSHIGAIVKYEIHNTGNWMHIKYKTRIQAKKALSKNCKIFARNIMIAVTPCIKKDIACQMDSTASVTSLNTPANPTAPGSLTTPSLGGTPSAALLVGTPNKPANMRSLSATPIRSAVPDALTAEHGTPKKNNSIVGKALEYVLGY